MTDPELTRFIKFPTGWVSERQEPLPGEESITFTVDTSPEALELQRREAEYLRDRMSRILPKGASLDFLTLDLHALQEGNVQWTRGLSDPRTEGRAIEDEELQLLMEQERKAFDREVYKGGGHLPTEGEILWTNPYRYNGREDVIVVSPVTVAVIRNSHHKPVSLLSWYHTNKGCFGEINGAWQDVRDKLGFDSIQDMRDNIQFVTARKLLTVDTDPMFQDARPDISLTLLWFMMQQRLAAEKDLHAGVESQWQKMSVKAAYNLSQFFHNVYAMFKERPGAEEGDSKFGVVLLLNNPNSIRYNTFIAEHPEISRLLNRLIRLPNRIEMWVKKKIFERVLKNCS